MMKVLHVNDYRTHGGAEIIVARTCALLRERGIEVQRFTSEDAPPHRLLPWRYISNRPARRALKRTLAEYQPDIVHVHNVYHRLSPGILGTLHAWQAARRSRAPRIVMTAHDHHLVCPNPLLRIRHGNQWQPAASAEQMGVIRLLFGTWDHRGRLHSMLRAAQWLWNYRVHDRRAVIDEVLCPSRLMTRNLAHAGLRAQFVPNPVSARIDQREKSGGALEMVFAGRVEPEKGLEPFLASLPTDIPFGGLTVIGSGSALPKCRAIAERRGLVGRVRFIGQRPHAETLSHIAGAHVLVLPSLCLENAPAVMFEALAGRTNLLVSDLGGMREIVDESGVGYCFDPTDADSLRQQLAAITARHAAGELNIFDPAPFLHERSPEVYLERLLAIYAQQQGEPSVTTPHGAIN